jgi:excisionase family DNA binding protein
MGAPIELNGGMEAARKAPEASVPVSGPPPSRSGQLPFLTAADVAQLLGVAKSFVYRRTSQGHGDPIPCYRFGGHLRFLRPEVEAWAEQHRKSAEPPPVVRLAASIEDMSTVRLRAQSRRS